MLSSWDLTLHPSGKGQSLLHTYFKEAAYSSLAKAHRHLTSISYTGTLLTPRFKHLSCIIWCSNRDLHLLAVCLVTFM